MLTPSLIKEYSIDFTLDRYSAETELLFSGNFADPEMEAQDQASNYRYFDIVYAFGPHPRTIYDGPFGITEYRTGTACLVAQIVVFRTKEGYEKYLRDKVLIFDNKEI